MDPFSRGMTFIFFFVVLGLGVLMYFDYKRVEALTERCNKAGGTMEFLHRDDLCLSSDGRILKV